ncbi:hypothetical protein M011DRAFT_484783 [Sporormia fimetaria CBS 119925]|uniref:Uncharacterized protein n=1 Tax=Sporormia fimetaria CBS 119925 TaxID=1340428 RepID=A0A6A6VI05_9PLEO|nr:hypothetical protein M011DRAFT_484783 [Sporormia fimetaria CBS 119925]
MPPKFKLASDPSMLPEDIRSRYEYKPEDTSTGKEPSQSFSGPCPSRRDQNSKLNPAAPESIYETPLTAHDLVCKLLDPPYRAFPRFHNKPGYMRFELSWVKKKILEAHFEHNPKRGRSVLRKDSVVRMEA